MSKKNKRNLVEVKEEIRDGGVPAGEQNDAPTEAEEKESMLDRVKNSKAGSVAIKIGKGFVLGGLMVGSYLLGRHGRNDNSNDDSSDVKELAPVDDAPIEYNFPED